jgi:hypothetical protein
VGDLEESQGLRERDNVAHVGLDGSEALGSDIEEDAEEDDAPENGIVKVVCEEVELGLARLAMSFLGWRRHRERRRIWRAIMRDAGSLWGLTSRTVNDDVGGGENEVGGC